NESLRPLSPSADDRRQALCPKLRAPPVTAPACLQWIASNHAANRSAWPSAGAIGGAFRRSPKGRVAWPGLWLPARPAAARRMPDPANREALGEGWARGAILR